MNVIFDTDGLIDALCNKEPLTKADICQIVPMFVEYVEDPDEEDYPDILLIDE
jgi:hypothetical protein